MITCNHRARRAFTLMELLVVIVVIGILSSMIFIPFGPDQEDVALRQAAIELRATIQKARSLAMQSQQTHAITFNIETPVESDGTVQVVRNFLPDDPDGFRGRHWYAIIGPTTNERMSDYGLATAPAIPPRANFHDNDTNLNRNLMLEVLRDHQIGPRHYLPRSVRFLALSDYDGGGDAWNNPRWDDDTGNWGRADHGMVYPVPWHGLVHQEAGGEWRLIPWGFYDDDLARTGVDGSLTSEDGSSNPDAPAGTMSAWGAGPITLTYRIGSGGTSSKTWEYPHFTYVDSTGTQVARLVEGGLMDAAMFFTPDGAVHWEHEYWQKAHLRIRGRHNWYTRDGDEYTARPWSSFHQTELTGGLHITLARDVDPEDDIYTQGDFHTFASRADALDAITPLLRVYVEQRSGLSEIREGPRQAPPQLDWVAKDGTVNDPVDMGSWDGVHPYCRIQQWQKLYNKSASDLRNPRAYHLPEKGDYVRFKPAGQY